jgi:hypothetical protein
VVYDYAGTPSRAISQKEFFAERRPFFTGRQVASLFLQRKWTMGDLRNLFSRGAWEVASVKRRRRSSAMAGDGKELFYLSGDSNIMAVPVKTGTNFNAGSPVILFQANPREMIATSEQFVYDVSNDGQKFLINTQIKTAMTPMSLVLNWGKKLQ